jgi:amidophosphoribosyltransferase
MSDSIKHECGIALIRLLKPLEYYQEKYGSSFYGLNKLNLLMQKQRNRGQDGAGIVTIKLDPQPGSRYISRKRSNAVQSIKDVFEQVFNNFKDLSAAQLADSQYLKDYYPYMGELMMGHLRYGTHGGNTIEQVHPFLRQNNWISRNLVLAGNFNMTNTDELFRHLVVELGQHPKDKSDTVTLMEKIGHFLDDEVQRLFNYYKPERYPHQKLTDLITHHLDVQRILRRAARKFDGGYVLAGLIGHGDAFVMRDPNGIRPAFKYIDDEVVVVASERPAIQTAFNVHFSKIEELTPGHALIVKKDGRISEVPFRFDQEMQPIQTPRIACSFERIYFSRGTDRDIYNERKKLGELLVPTVLKSIHYDFENTVFSFIPNTAETAFFGLCEGLQKYLAQSKKEKILALGNDITPEKLDEILKVMPRIEKIAVKDEKLRTFITSDAARGEMVSYVYDVTYGIVQNEVDTLVLLDDSIVRGTTLRNSIIKIVSRLRPKKIIIISSAPQIRYPDCYGIDMSKLGDFVAFNALVELLKENNMEHELWVTYEQCKAQEHLPKENVKNELVRLYNMFKCDEVSRKITQIITPPDIAPAIEVIYQTIEALHIACPNHTGDWYFSGNYPTPGGNAVVNKAFMNYMENKNVRAY